MKTNYSEDKINTNSSLIEEALNDIQLGNLKSFSSVEELIKDLNQVDDSLEN